MTQQGLSEEQVVRATQDEVGVGSGGASSPLSVRRNPMTCDIAPLAYRLRKWRRWFVPRQVEE